MLDAIDAPRRYSIAVIAGLAQCKGAECGAPARVRADLAEGVSIDG
jgi:hypothetical protein